MHAAVLAAVLFAWPASRVINEATEPVSVEVLTVDELTRMTEMPKPSMAAAPRETSAPDQAQAESQQEPEPAQAPADTPPLPDQKPKPEKAPADKPQLDASRLENLIDKSLKQANRKPLNVSELARTLEKDIAKKAVLDVRAAITLQQLMDAQVSRCFNPPTGGSDVANMTVTLRLRLDPEGKIVDPPVIVRQTGMTEGNRAYAQALASAARRAVIKCAPYDLPKELAPVWAGQELELNFDPSRLM